jgi:WD40 repeat protein
MVLGLEIGLIVAGLIVLVTGKFKLGKNRVARGAAARFAGAVLLLPLPLAFGIGFIVGLERAGEGQPLDSADFKLTLSLMELGVCIVCALVGFGIALALAVPSEQGERRREKAAPAEESLWVYPVEEQPEAIRKGPLPARPTAQKPVPVARAIPLKRSKPAASSDSRAAWWVLGGLAVGCVACMLLFAVLVWWQITSSATPAPASPEPVVEARPPLGAPPFQAKDQDWGQPLPQRQLPGGPDGMPPGGQAQIPAHILPPIEVKVDPPKPKPPPEGLRAALDLGSTPTALALSPNGRTLAVAANDLAVTLWDVAAAQQRTRLAGNEKEVTTLVFSPDGKWLATADAGPFVKLRDAASGKQQASIDIGDNNARVTALSFSPDNKTLLLVAGGLVKLHDLETSKQRDLLDKNPQARQTNWFHGRFTADGKMVYLNGLRGLQNTTVLWDTAGKLVEDLHIFPDRALGGALMTPDERHFIFVALNEPIVRVWDRTARREVTPLEGKTMPTGLAFSPDGELVVLGYGDGMVRLWDYKNGKHLGQFEANRDDEHLPPVKNDGRLVGPLGMAQAVRGLAFSADGKWLITGQSNGFKIWDAAKAFGRPFAAAPAAGKPPAPAKADGVRQLTTFQAVEKAPGFRPRENALTSLALAPDGGVLATSAGADGQELLGGEAGEIKLWKVDGQKELARAAGPGVAGFTPDGKHLLCILPVNALDFVAGALGKDGNPKMEDLFALNFALRDARTLELRPGRVRCAGGVISPDGKYLLTKHITGNVPVLRLYELDTLKELHVWKHVKGGNIGALAFAPDGQSFAASLTGKPDVVICDAATGKPRCTLTGHTNEVRAAAFSPDAKRLATGGLDRTIKLWDAATGKSLATLEGHTSGIAYLTYAHDGKLLVSLGDDGTLHLWDTAQEKALASLEAPAGTTPPVMAFLPNGKVLAAGRGKEVRLWDISALVGPSVAVPVTAKPHPPDPIAPKPAEPPPKPRNEAPPPKSRTAPPPLKKAEAVSPPPRAPEKGGVRELRSMRISKNSYVHVLLFTPDGREVVSAGDDGRVRRWSVETGKELETSFDAHPRVTMLSISLSADGKLLATSSLDKTAKVWNTADNKLLTTCDCAERLPFVHAALSPNGKLLATGTNQVRLWDAATGREIGPLKSQPAFIDAITFSPDSKRLACSGSRNTVKLWDVTERKELATLTGHTRPVMGLAFSADGKTLASASIDKTIKLWDLETNKERLTLPGHADPLSSVAFSPDGTLLVSGAGAVRADPGHLGEVKLWDAKTGQLLADLKGHTDGVSSVAFSPDGKKVASVGRDHAVRLWDVAGRTKE